MWELVEAGGWRGRCRRLGEGELRPWQDIFLPQASLPPQGSVVKCPLLAGALWRLLLLGGGGCHTSQPGRLGERCPGRPPSG